LPNPLDMLTAPSDDDSGTLPVVSAPRYQVWPERMIRGAGSALNTGVDVATSGVNRLTDVLMGMPEGLMQSVVSGTTLAGDVASGAQPVFDPETGHVAEPVIQRAQDMAGLAGGGALTEKPGVATLGSGPIRRPDIGALMPAPKNALKLEPIQGLNKAMPTLEMAEKVPGTPEEWASHFQELPEIKNALMLPEFKNTLDANGKATGKDVADFLKKVQAVPEKGAAPIDTSMDRRSFVRGLVSTVANAPRILKFVGKALEAQPAQVAEAVAGPKVKLVNPSAAIKYGMSPEHEKELLRYAADMMNENGDYTPKEAVTEARRMWKEEPGFMMEQHAPELWEDQVRNPDEIVSERVHKEMGLPEGPVPSDRYTEFSNRHKQLRTEMGDDLEMDLGHRYDPGTQFEIPKPVKTTEMPAVGETRFASQARDVFRTADGKTFPTRQEAMAHHKELEKGNFNPVTLRSDTSEPGAALAAAENAPAFYSALEHATTNAAQDTMSPQQWLGYLKNQPGVKKEELDWTGLEGWLGEQKGKVKKADVQQYLDAHKTELKDVTKGGLGYDDRALRAAVDDHVEEMLRDHEEEEGRPATVAERAQIRQSAEDTVRENPEEFGIKEDEASTKYSSYQLPGGENYREHLITMPKKNSNPKPTGDEAGEIAHYAEQRRRGRELTPEQQTRDDELVAKSRAFYGAEDAAPSYRSSHWDEPNVLAHVRTNDRVFPGETLPSTGKPRTLDDVITARDARAQELGNDTKRMYADDKYMGLTKDWETLARKNMAGDKTATLPATDEPRPVKSLHLEEIQSDWHQQGRKQGYKVEPTKSANELRQANKSAEDYTEGLRQKYGDDDWTTEMTPEERQTHRSLWDVVRDFPNREAMARTSGVPDAPFKTTWPELALKRMIRHAAENGYDRISWTPGEAQAARYDLSKHYDALQVYKHKEGDFSVWGKTSPNAAAQQLSMHVAPEKLPDVVGKDLAEKISQQTEDKKEYSGVDLKVGGEGMREFYDKMLPKMVEKIGKSHGVKVKTTKIKTEDVQHPDDQAPVHYFDLPQSLKDQALRKGFPLYVGSIPFPLTPVNYNPFEKKK